MTEIVVNEIRIQVLSETLVRVEEKGPKGFENRTTYTVVERDWPGADITESRNERGTTISASFGRLFIPANAVRLAEVEVSGM